jgi:hypothetical protein
VSYIAGSKEIDLYIAGSKEIDLGNVLRNKIFDSNFSLIQ